MATREVQDKMLYDEVNSGVYETYFNIGPGNFIIDVGAHIGSFSQRAVAAGATVMAFEPDPDNQMRFEAWLAISSVPVAYYGRAVWSKSGEIKTLHQNPEHSGASSLIWDFGGPSFKTATVALDDLNIEKCDLLKIDAEASEIEILRGAKNLIERLRPVLVMEIHSVDLYNEMCAWFAALPNYVITRDCSTIPANHYTIGIFWALPKERLSWLPI